MDKSNLKLLEQNFRELIIERCRFCKFDQYLAENPDFAFPKLTPANFDTKSFIIVPGLYGGFAYYLESVDGEPVLYAEQSSRMDYSGDDYAYFLVTTDGSKVLEGEARVEVQQKFHELVMQEHEQRKRGNDED